MAKIDLIHKLLASGQLYDSTVEGNVGWVSPGWTGSPLYTAPPSVNAIPCSGTDVKLMYFHNTDDVNALNVQTFFYGTGDANRSLTVDLPKSETMEWDFGYIMHLNTGEAIYGNVESGNPNTINYNIYGAEIITGIV